MEAPSRGDPETLRDAQTAVLKAMVEADPHRYVRGQYDGYTSIEGVASGSSTETYCAMRLEIENWRWSGVPIIIRTGKHLPVTQTELRLVFKHSPKLGFGLRQPHSEPDQLAVKLDPSTACGSSCRPIGPTRRNRNQSSLTSSSPPRAARDQRRTRCCCTVMTGRSARFARQDTVEEAWRVMQPLLDDPPPVQMYAPGILGSGAADALVADVGGWRGPWI